MKRALLIATALSWHTAIAQTPSLTRDGFALPQPNRTFSFPRDHGSHPDFRTEWWYITGHLDATDGRRFGFQVTFFRQASPTRQQLYLAHTAVFDANKRQFLSEERLNREGWDAESSTSTLDVHNGNWSLVLNDNTFELKASIRSEAKLALKLVPAKPLVTFGKEGVSRKGASPEAASHYLTFPRMTCKGAVNTGSGEIEVSGSAWMDHEFSSSQLDRDQVGWDWASLQLNDGREFMVYRMRRRDGSNDPAGTTLAQIKKDGSVEQIDASGFTWEPKRTWKSPVSGASYPIEARIISHGEVFDLKPLFDAQELDGAISGLPYWEGACDVHDASGKTIGRAFLELAGYAGDLARHLRGALPK